MMMTSFDHRGYLVRLIYGAKPQVFEVPGKVVSRYWLFSYGFSVTAPSMTEALLTTERLLKRARK
jgi:hypothetical protein